jgi:hypothetical protein
LALCQAGLVTRLGKSELRLPMDLGIISRTGIECAQRSLDPQRCEHLQQLRHTAASTRSSPNAMQRSVP